MALEKELERLKAHPSQGGNDLRADDPRVLAAEAKLDKELLTSWLRSRQREGQHRG